jgi:bacterioferritin-associated ferredoxin
MYLCLCNALTQRRVAAALAEHHAVPRVSDAYRACGCTALCGACAAEMQEAVRAERCRRGAAPPQPGAD